ncbi:MAPEG family protein [Sorangium sp. So ce327]|jgi:hypothetical protein|uniref:MAPEG family protein n=1 Tax=Sorangium sp. So ce327 TaxID=3133301 RepID=UPI003F62EB86
MPPSTHDGASPDNGAQTPEDARSLLGQYIQVTLALAALVVGLVVLCSRPPEPAGAPKELIQPVVALVALTALVWLLMVGFRNMAVIRGLASMRYFRGTFVGVPPEWVERPARAFGNLLEVPTLFYAVCAFMLVTGKYDHTQVLLAWVFVALRALHALIHIAWNFVPFRFAAFVGGCVTLGVLWVRFAQQSL